MVDEQKITEKETSCYLFSIFHDARTSESKTFFQQRRTTKKNSQIWEEQKIAEKEKSCYLFGVLHSAHGSKIKTFVKQRKTTKIS